MTALAKEQAAAEAVRQKAVQATIELERQEQGIRDKQKALREGWMDDEKGKWKSGGKGGKRSQQERWYNKLHDKIKQKRKWKDDGGSGK